MTSAPEDIARGDGADRRHGPGEWRVLRIRIKQAVMTDSARRAVRALGQDASQILVVGGPAADEELLTVPDPRSGTAAQTPRC
jgi:hypothetical protein